MFNKSQTFSVLARSRQGASRTGQEFAQGKGAFGHRIPPGRVAGCSTTRTAIWLLPAGFLLLAILGCAGYRLGPVNGVVAGAKSVQVVPFVNQTLEPHLSDATTSQLHQELQRDGTYRLATRNDGDIIVSGVLTRYQRREVSFSSNDTRTVTDYGLVLTARVTARERATGKIILDRPVSGYTLLSVGSDLVSSERQALPLLAGDLAKHVTALLVEGSW